MRMHLPDEQGSTRHEMLTRFSKKTKKQHPDLIAPQINPTVVYLWRYFKDLDAARHDYKKLTYQELAAFEQVTDRKFTRWEIVCLRKVDSVWCKAYYEVRNGFSKSSNTNSNSGHK